MGRFHHEPLERDLLCSMSVLIFMSVFSRGIVESSCHFPHTSFHPTDAVVLPNWKRSLGLYHLPECCYYFSQRKNGLAPSVFQMISALSRRSMDCTTLSATQSFVSLSCRNRSPRHLICQNRPEHTQLPLHTSSYPSTPHLNLFSSPALPSDS